MTADAHANWHTAAGLPAHGQARHAQAGRRAQPDLQPARHVTLEGMRHAQQRRAAFLQLLLLRARQRRWGAQHSAQIGAGHAAACPAAWGWRLRRRIWPHNKARRADSQLQQRRRRRRRALLLSRCLLLLLLSTRRRLDLHRGRCLCSRTNSCRLRLLRLLRPCQRASLHLCCRQAALHGTQQRLGQHERVVTQVASLPGLGSSKGLDAAVAGATRRAVGAARAKPHQRQRMAHRRCYSRSTAHWTCCASSLHAQPPLPWLLTASSLPAAAPAACPPLPGAAACGHAAWHTRCGQGRSRQGAQLCWLGISASFRDPHTIPELRCACYTPA